MTEEKELIPLISNTMFQEAFGRDENKIMLTYLISQYFNIDFNFALENIKHQNTNQSMDNIKDYKYDVDILNLNDEIIINIEMNKNFWIGLENRNLAYITKIFPTQYISGEGRKQFKECKKHIQLNFNNYNYPKNRNVSISRLKDIETNEELTDLIEIHNVNLEVIYKNCYNKCEEDLTPIEKITIYLKTTNIRDMEKIVGEGMESILDKVIELSNDERLVGLYNKEELREAREYGMHLAGKEEGIKQTQKQVVIKMLEDDLDINIISKYTNLNIEDILEIKKELI